MSSSITGRCGVLLAWALMVTAAGAGCAQSAVVDANQYDAFWLWAGVRSQPVLAHARTVYLLDAEVRPGRASLLSQRPALPHVTQAEVWMVVRVETLDWPEGMYAQVLGNLARWHDAGNHLAGLQIDFDARTRHLAEYATFLAGLRRRLPAGYKLSITGLLDWSSHGDASALNALAGTVDEVALQIYQGRHVIRGYQAYLAGLNKVRIPFRIGLLQGGEWHAPPGLSANPQFRGYIVFLVNPA